MALDDEIEIVSEIEAAEGPADFETEEGSREKTPAEAAFAADVEYIGSQLHDEWRATRLQSDGSYEPRVKPTTDEIWIKNHGGETQVDIANTSYDELPADWQEENHASAEVALGCCYQIALYGKGHFGDREFFSLKELLDEASTNVHDKWLKRNEAWAPEDQKLPFYRLSEPEKDKDRVIVLYAAAKLVQEHLDNGTFQIPENLMFEWTAKDIKYLIDLADEEAFAKEEVEGIIPQSFFLDPKKDNLNGWSVEIKEYKLLGDRRVEFGFNIPTDSAKIYGIFYIEDVARLMRELRYNPPDSADIHNDIRTQMRKKAIDELLSKELGQVQPAA